MIEYPYKVNLSQRLINRLKKAIENRSPIALRLTDKDMIGNHQLLLTRRQINKIKSIRVKEFV